MTTILIISAIAGLATIAGAFLVIIFGRPSERALAILLGAAAGIMLGVVIMDLLPASLKQGTYYQALFGFGAGLLLMASLDGILGFLNPTAISQFNRQKFLRKMGLLMAIGIALHDFPEGIAIAAGYSAQGNLGLLLALSIGLHNIPEGMAMATPLIMGGVSRRTILLINCAVSLCTPLGTYLGWLLVNNSTRWIGVLLALAAGAMSYLIKEELIPEAKRNHPRVATLGLVGGIFFIFWVGLLG